MNDVRSCFYFVYLPFEWLVVPQYRYLGVSTTNCTPQCNLNSNNNERRLDLYEKIMGLNEKSLSVRTCDLDHLDQLSKICSYFLHINATLFLHILLYFDICNFI